MQPLTVMLKKIFNITYLTYLRKVFNYFSHRPLHISKSIFIGIIDKIFKLYDPAFGSKNIKFIKSLLINNRYPLDFINNIIKKRLNDFFLQNNILSTENHIISKRIVISPFFKNISKKVCSFFTIIIYVVFLYAKTQKRSYRLVK